MYLYVHCSTIHSSEDMETNQMSFNDDWIKMWYMYVMEYYLAIRKDEILPFATTWIDLESIMLSKISQMEKNKYHMISLICRI